MCSISVRNDEVLKMMETDNGEPTQIVGMAQEGIRKTQLTILFFY